jgi:hypothetical protein
MVSMCMARMDPDAVHNFTTFLITTPHIILIMEKTESKMKHLAKVSYDYLDLLGQPVTYFRPSQTTFLSSSLMSISS